MKIIPKVIPDIYTAARENFARGPPPQPLFNPPPRYIPNPLAGQRPPNPFIIQPPVRLNRRPTPYEIYNPLIREPYNPETHLEEMELLTEFQNTFLKAGRRRGFRQGKEKGIETGKKIGSFVSKRVGQIEGKNLMLRKIDREFLELKQQQEYYEEMEDSYEQQKIDEEVQRERMKELKKEQKLKNEKIEAIKILNQPTVLSNIKIRKSGVGFAYKVILKNIVGIPVVFVAYNTKDLESIATSFGFNSYYAFKQKNIDVLGHLYEGVNEFTVNKQNGERTALLIKKDRSNKSYI